MFRHTRHIHFVGIGGIGMSGIAELLVNLGYRVSGSDRAVSDITERLQGLGARIYQGHKAEQVLGADVVVISSAIPKDNIEVRAARARAIPVIPRAEMLAELMRMKYGLAVAGTHGKTTTTSLLAVICAEAGLDPTVVVGGRLRSLGSNARLGQGEYLVAEADESDGSFLRLSPTIAVVTNIDAEHLDHYGTFDKLVDAFRHFVNQVPFYGGAVLCFDHPVVRGLLPDIEKPVITYGFAAQAELRAHSLQVGPRGVRFSVDLFRDPLGSIHLPLMGRHNVLNALGALGAALELDIPFDVAAKALTGFEGVGRRIEAVGDENGILVVDDYGHHPTEVRATLRGIREHHDRPVRVVFQPHRYSRTKDLFEEFLGAFDDADNVAILDIYPAGEAPIEGVSTERLVQAMRARGHRRVEHRASLEDALEWLEETARPGELVITLGAGSVSKLAKAFVRSMRGEQAWE